MIGSADEASQIDALRHRFDALRAAVFAQPVPSLSERRAHLTALERALRGAVPALETALDADFGRRSVHETRLLEIFPTIEAIRYARRRLARWAAPQPAAVAPYFLPARAQTMWQPLGVVGIIAPWNYPLLLALGPLIGALGAGNRAILKFSELAPATAEVVARLIAGAFPDGRVAVVWGGAELGRAFATLPFDHLLFTGSTQTGRSVMRAAAGNLTPVTLELGGKSPAIVGADAPLERTAARLLSAKCRNAGQTCIAPDYALLPEGRVDAFVRAARRIVSRRYPARSRERDTTWIVSDAQYARLRALRDEAGARGATVIPLLDDASNGAAGRRRMTPAILTGVDDGMRIMREEIFGPLLPIRTYRSLAEAIAYVNARPRPLALYYFGHHRADIATVLRETTSGGACINDALLQFAQESLPFGGVGPSGMGAYHGRAGFETFSHRKAVFTQAPYSAFGLFDPPYGRFMDVVLTVLGR